MHAEYHAHRRRHRVPAASVARRVNRRQIRLMNAVCFVAEQLCCKRILMSGRRGQRRARSRPVHQRLDGAVAAIGRNPESRDAVAVADRVVVNPADGATRRGIEYHLAVLHHQAAGQLQLLYITHRCRSAADQKLAAADRHLPVRIGYPPQCGIKLRVGVVLHENGDRRFAERDFVKDRRPAWPHRRGSNRERKPPVRVRQ